MDESQIEGSAVVEIITICYQDLETTAYDSETLTLQHHKSYGRLDKQRYPLPAKRPFLHPQTSASKIQTFL